MKSCGVLVLPFLETIVVKRVADLDCRLIAFFKCQQNITLVLNIYNKVNVLSIFQWERVINFIRDEYNLLMINTD